MKYFLSFMLFFIMGTGTIGKAEKQSTREETKFHHLKCQMCSATKEERAQLLEKLVNQCDCNFTLTYAHGNSDYNPRTLSAHALYYLAHDTDQWEMKRCFFKDLSSTDFERIRKVAANKAASSLDCQKITDNIAQKAEKTRAKEEKKKKSKNNAQNI